MASALLVRVTEPRGAEQLNIMSTRYTNIMDFKGLRPFHASHIPNTFYILDCSPVVVMLLKLWNSILGAQGSYTKCLLPSLPLTLSGCCFCLLAGLHPSWSLLSTNFLLFWWRSVCAAFWWHPALINAESSCTACVISNL